MLTMGPPAVVFLTLVASPIVYAIPAAFLCVDLASAYPFDGGMVSWVDIAYGTFIGGHNMFWFVRSATVLFQGRPHP